MNAENNTTPTFYGLGIAPKLLDVIHRAKYTHPTPIQEKSIPIAVEGKDVIGIAQTGTGKTLAFGIPMIQRLAQTKGRGLIILPTRELAIQVQESMDMLGHGIGLRTALLIGGASMGMQLQNLRKKPHILIVTPGRLIDHIEQRSVNLSDVHVLVLDEADRMLDMGFAPQINRILKLVPKERQTMLFSATMPPEIVKIATSYMQLPIRVEIARAGTASANIEQELVVLRREDKIRMLDKLLADNRGPILVFSRTKHGATKISRAVNQMGHRSAEIHSNRSLSQRREALDGFKAGKYKVLVATDIAARGIDVKGIELVINFDLPDNSEDYVHRIGRTGRAGHLGRAISFATPDQSRDVRDIERLMRITLKRASVSDLPPARAPQPGDDRPEPVGRSYGSARPRSGGSGGYGGKSYGAKSYGTKNNGSTSYGKPRAYGDAPRPASGTSYGGDARRPSAGGGYGKPAGGKRPYPRRGSSASAARPKSSW